MKTIIERIDPNNINTEIISRAGEIIKNGGLVAFPTETVYGLGGDALKAESSEKIYAAKGRPSDNPLIVHISDMADLGPIVSEIPEDALKLADAFWPGPLTVIMNKSKLVPYKTTGGLDTVAVRFPSDPVARAFIKESGGYIAAPSANISGRPSPTSGKHVVEDMDGRIDMILYGDDSLIGLESTIVDLTGDKPMILRPGFVTADMVRKILPDVIFDPALTSVSKDAHPKAPGMKYRHYAPKGSLVIVEGEPKAVVSYINNRLNEDKAKGKRTGVIVSSATAGSYLADRVYTTGDAGDEQAVAHNLFGILRQTDDDEIDSIYSESFEDDGIGTAIMNRLLKAAGHNIVHI